MMGTRSPQDKLFAADQIYLDFVGRDTLYGYLAQNRQHLFRDEDFAALYCADNGRTSVPPSLAISILFLRAYEKGEVLSRPSIAASTICAGRWRWGGDGRSTDAEEHAAGVRGQAGAAPEGGSAAEEVD